MLQPPQIIQFPETTLIGLRQTMSFAQNTTPQLWGSFMPRLKEVENRAGSGRFSLQNYPDRFFENFSPNIMFEKWAAVPVTSFDIVPAGMEAFTLPAGKYAVFHYKGNPANAPRVFQYILGEWLPQSGYRLDTRPHFGILGSAYKNGADDSEEDIYIPIML